MKLRIYTDIHGHEILQYAEDDTPITEMYGWKSVPKVWESVRGSTIILEVEEF